MASREPTPFGQLLLPAEFRRGKLLRALVWATAGSLLLTALLIVVYLATDLVAHGGRLLVARPLAADLDRLVGTEVERDGPGTNTEVVYSGRGVLPEVWWDRNRYGGPLMAWAYLRIPYLRTDPEALLVLVLLGGLLGLFANRCISRARNLCLRDALDRVTRLRLQLHRQVLRLGPSDLQGTEHAQAMELFVRDADSLRDALFLKADRFVRDPFQLALLGLLPLSVAPVLALQCGIPLVATGYVVREAFRRLRASERLRRAQGDRQLGLLAESLQKTRLIRGYGMDEFERQQFERYLLRYETETAAVLHERRRTERWGMALGCLTIAFVLLVLGGKVLFEPHELSVAAAILIVASFGAAWFPLSRLVSLHADLSDGRESAVRVSAYLAKIPEVGQAVGAKFLSPLSKTLEFENVHYGLEGRPVLDGFSVRLEAGRQIGLISTDALEARAVAFLLPRFIEPQSGKVTIDNEDIGWVTLESLRAETVFVGGRDPFFTGTVAENLAAGDSRFTLQDLTDAAKLVHAHNFIQKLPQGYETAIGEHGEQLDAGQAFRLGLARAMLRKPALLIIEEPPSSLLDDETKQLIDDAYLRIAPGRTVIYIPSRLTTIRRCDPLVFIHKGKLEAVGPRSRMIQHSPLYQHWEYLNFNEFRHELEPQASG